jgi:hypothetical protein
VANVDGGVDARIAGRVEGLAGRGHVISSALAGDQHSAATAQLETRSNKGVPVGSHTSRAGPSAAQSPNDKEGNP